MLYSPAIKPEYVQSLTYLNKVSWQPFRAITIIEGKSCAERWKRNTKSCSGCHHHTPRSLAALYSFTEERVKKQVRQLWIAFECCLYVTQEHAVMTNILDVETLSQFISTTNTSSSILTNLLWTFLALEPYMPCLVWYWLKRQCQLYGSQKFLILCYIQSYNLCLPWCCCNKKSWLQYGASFHYSAFTNITSMILTISNTLMI